MVGGAKGSCLSVVGKRVLPCEVGVWHLLTVFRLLACRQRRNLRPVQQERRRSRTLRPVPVPDDQLVHSRVQGGGTVGGDSPPQGTMGRGGGVGAVYSNVFWHHDA